ncbi:hypothetical protein ACSSS7_008389 [Eimeria intestinalis]
MAMGRGGQEAEGGKRPEGARDEPAGKRGAVANAGRNGPAPQAGTPNRQEGKGGTKPRGENKTSDYPGEFHPVRRKSQAKLKDIFGETQTQEVLRHKKSRTSAADHRR